MNSGVTGNNNKVSVNFKFYNKYLFLSRNKVEILASKISKYSVARIANFWKNWKNTSLNSTNVRTGLMQISIISIII